MFDPVHAQPQPQRPNIVVIMGDDIGMWNIGAYHQGVMAGRTPNLDRIAAEGMRFTDYYAEASCTAGRANFITGQLPIRTGLGRRLSLTGHDPLARQVPAGKVENGIISGMDWFPTLVATAATEHHRRAEKGQANRRPHLQGHLDGYNQMDLITGKGPSNRHEIFYFTEGTIERGADRRLQVSLHRSAGRLAGRHSQGGLADPHQPPPRSIRAHRVCPAATRDRCFSTNWFAFEFWRFQFVQKEVVKLAQTAIEFPPMQKGASFNLEAVKATIEAAIERQRGK